MSNGRIGARFQSVTEMENMDPFTGMDRVKRRLKAIEKRVGLNKNPVPVVTGTTDTQKLASLITALSTLGLIETA